MISVTEALEHLARHRKVFGTEKIPLLQSPGRVLAVPVLADRDLPPYHRVTMDGIAINSLSFQRGHRSFRIAGIQPAGHPMQLLRNMDECLEVMTGATLPANTDAVVRYEDCDIQDGVATLRTDAVQPFQNIHIQAADIRQDEVLILPGKLITPAMVGIMATVGMEDVPVQRLPRVVVCSTGDELVEVAAMPEAHQIRRSNVYALCAALLAEGIIAHKLHFPDDREALRKALRALQMQYDVILLSGAVSKGKYDFLPGVLAELGMDTVFHRVAQKPGKPMLFGTFPDGPLVFGFPGNPASTLVCYHLYFRPWLHGSLGHEPPVHTAVLTEDITFSPNLTLHQLVRVEHREGQNLAVPVPSTNSGDAVSLMKADGFISLDTGSNFFPQGSIHHLTSF